ncbi:PQQ-binding-like beta-propeller repeat protein [Cellulomonas hominis]|uniref:outer membrane protein assembly factor BamB family protein n=1 Tax=Cellulomonas hominis TaxID=156981 RepID=UPI001B95B44A|nr:PQQ-binding-like beta-propeller repeat protein [Cellulomonas hominis]VTR75460.1 hypothetical protein CHMI_00205 [Cellulomonas hominis]
MDDVELVEAPARGADPGPARTARRARVLRVLRRWWPVPVAVVLAAVVWQAASGAQERAVAERLRETPGVIGTTVAPPLTTRDWGDPASTGVVTSAPLGGGLVVAAEEGPDGAARTVVGIDAATGRERWRVAAGGEENPRGREPVGATCGDAAGPLVWCSFTSVRTFGEASFEPVATLVLVDVTARAEVPAPDLPRASSVVVLDDVAVTVSRVGDAAVVDATDLTTGASRWHVELADPAGRLVGHAPDPSVVVAGHRVHVTGGTGTWALDAVDGRLVAAAQDLRLLRGEQLVAVDGGAVTRLLGPDGRGTARADGAPVPVEPDDGSAPGVLLLARVDAGAGGRLRAVAAASGEVLWERPAQVDGLGPLVLLDGLLYGTDREGLWAVDATTGRAVWSTAAGTRAGPALMTDGVHLLRTEHDPGRAGATVLAAYGLRDGDRRWAEPLPEGLTDVRAVGGVLLGFGTGRPVLVE